MIDSHPAHRLLLIRLVLLLALATGVASPRAANKSLPTGDWPEITPAEKSLSRVQQDPEADVVILNNERNGKILKRADEWVNVMDFHWRAKVLTDAGQRMESITQVRIPAGKGSRVSNIRARTIRPDGTVQEVPQDQIFEKRSTLGGVKISEWTFSFPSVEPGSILEYKYDRHDDYLGFIRPFFLEGGAFTLRARATQAMPTEAGYQILCSRCPPGTQPTIRKWVEGPAKGKMYELELHDLPGYQDEILMPPRPEVSPRLEMVLNTWKDWFSEALGRQDRFFVDWPSAARMAEYYYEKAMKEGQPALRAALNGWVEGAADPQAKVDAILRHVREDFRYIPWDNVYGWSRPISTLLEDMTADNEEKAVLMRAALAAAGVESRFALVAGRNMGVFNPEFFGLSQFTHVVVAVPKPDGSYEWLDPTVPYAPRGFVPSRDSGAKALLIKDGSGQLVDLPVKNELPRRRFEITVRPKEDGTADLSVSAEYAGEDAVELRGELAPAGAEARREFLSEWLRGHLAGATLTSLDIENLDHPDEPLKVKIEATATGIVTRADEALLVRGSLLSGFDSNPIRRPVRSNDLCVDRGWNVQEAVVIETPAGMEPAPLPPPVKADSGVARMSFQCSTTLEGHARCSRLFTASPRRWPPNYMENFRKMMDRLVEADRTNVVLQKKAGQGS